MQVNPLLTRTSGRLHPLLPRARGGSSARPTVRACFKSQRTIYDRTGSASFCDPTIKREVRCEVVRGGEVMGACVRTRARLARALRAARPGPCTRSSLLAKLL